jgi:hypothetical protein
MLATKSHQSHQTRARHRLQHRGYAVWWLCTVLRDLADPSDPHQLPPSAYSDIGRLIRCGSKADIAP